MRHPGVPPELRGTDAGLGHDAALAHLVNPGVTAVELLPVHQHVPARFLVERGLTNYWGYNTIGFYAPHDGYSAAVRAGRPGAQVAQFQAMVAALHAAGLEVLLDVVFNHTAEGAEGGPTLCHRGLDNPPTAGGARGGLQAALDAATTIPVAWPSAAGRPRWRSSPPAPPPGGGSRCGHSR
jgi:pullulanase/glycogen debranching enzyme